MNEAEIHRHITELVTEEHQLERSHVGSALSPDEHQRLKDVGVELDRCWDLLRQRDARRHAGQDPDGAETRSTGVVEGYLQ